MSSNNRVFNSYIWIDFCINHIIYSNELIEPTYIKSLYFNILIESEYITYPII